MKINFHIALILIVTSFHHVNRSTILKKIFKKNIPFLEKDYPNTIEFYIIQM